MFSELNRLFPDEIPLDAIRREAMEFAGIGIWTFRFDGVVLAADDTVFRIFELEDEYPSAADLAGKNITELVDYASHGSLRSKIREHGRIRGVEWRFTTHRGTPKCVLEDSYLVPGEGCDDEDYVLVVMRDITGQKRAQEAFLESERVRAEEALRASEQRYQVVLQTIEDGYYETDLAGNLTFFNDALCRMLGYDADEMKQMSYRQLMTPGMAGRVYASFNAVYVSGKGSRSFGWVLRHKSGASRHIDTSISLRRDSSGRCVGFRGIARDITQRIRAEQALRESEAKFRVLSEATSAGVFLHRGGHLLYANSEAAAVFGCSVEDLSEKSFWELVHPDFQEVVKLRGEARLKGESCPSQYEVKAHDEASGEDRWYDLRLRTLDFEGGPAVLGTAFDITARKRAESELAKHREHLEELVAQRTAELSDVNEQLRQAQKMESIGRLAGGVAHDFNNLLSVILGYSDLAVQEIEKDSPLYRKLVQILDAGERARDLTQQLLAFSRKQVLEMKVLDLNEVVADLEKMLRRLLGEEVRLATILDPCAGQIAADSTQLQQILMNLAVNAKDAMPEGGQLTIETKRVHLDAAYAHRHPGMEAGAYVLLAVSDTGHGMSGEVKAQIFEPFFTTKERGKGTGLGLSTVHGIVEQHGGSIHVYSEVGRGTTFKVYFPAAEPTCASESARGPRASSAGGSESILVVEDDDDVRGLVVDILENHGYHVRQAASGEAALEAFQTAPFAVDLLLTDVVMPGMTGREVCDRLTGQIAGLRVLYMSGYTDEAIARQGLLEPGTDLLQKPFSAQGLTHKVRRVLDAPAGRGSC